MTTVCVRSLSGECLDIEMMPDMTFAELRARIEEAVPDVPHFHVVKVFEGLRELTDNDAFVDLELSEIQTFVAMSPAKAIAKLVQVGQANNDVWDDAEEMRLVHDAATILGMTAGLSDVECDALVTSSNFVGFEPGERWRLDMYELAVAILENLGRSLAASNNPAKYRDALLDESSEINVMQLESQVNGKFYFAEMVERHGVDWIPDQRHSVILNSCLFCVRHAIAMSSWCHNRTLQAFVSLRIVGLLGDASHEPLLQEFLDVFTPNIFFIFLQKEAAAALQRIRDRVR